MLAQWRSNKIAAPLLVVVSIIFVICYYYLNEYRCKRVVFVTDGKPLRPSIYSGLVMKQNTNFSKQHRPVFMFARKSAPPPKAKPENDTGLRKFRFTGCPPVDRWSGLEEDTVEVPDGINNPHIVHYLWLQKEVFTFRNYLSVLSVLRFVQPVKIVFHIFEEPMPDKTRYNQWWEELIASVPNIFINKFPPHSGGDKTELMRTVLLEHGGLVIPNDVIFIQKLSNFTPKHIIHIKLEKAKRSDVIAMTSDKGQFVSFTGCLRLDWAKSVSNKRIGEWPCVELPFEVFPHEFLTAKDGFSELVRFLFYGSPSAIVPKMYPSSEGGISPICHYVWIGGVEMDLVAYLSILSCLHIAKAETVLIHGDKPPKGFRWQRLLGHVGSSGKVKFLRQEEPESVYGNEVSNRAHISDVWRVDTLLKYGGVYLDWDAILLKPFSELENVGALANFDIAVVTPFPYTFNLGVFAARKNAPYLKYLKESMRYFADHGAYEFVYRYNPCQIPFKVFECFPDTLKIERRLQVICYLEKCHPTWEADFTNTTLGYDIDWQNDGIFAIHWTYPNPIEFESETALKAAIAGNSSSMAVQIAKHILASAGTEL